jgi:hypothetical protein
MGVYQDAAEKFRVLTSLSGTGILGPYICSMEQEARIVVNGVGGGNSIDVEARISGSPIWDNLTTIIGTTTGENVDLTNYDEVRFNVTAFAASGEPLLIASGFLP